jgi:hypothetical protein
MEHTGNENRLVCQRIDFHRGDNDRGDKGHLLQSVFDRLSSAGDATITETQAH